MGYEFFRYWKRVTDGIKAERSDGQQLLYLTFTGTDDVTLYGGDTSGDDLKIYANTVDTAPYIFLLGGSDIAYSATNHVFYYTAGVIGRIINWANGAIIDAGDTTGDDLRLRSNETDGDAITIEGGGDIVFAPTGDMKFGTYAAIVAETLQGYVTIKDSAGNSRKLGVVA